MSFHSGTDEDALRKALMLHAEDPDYHDLTLIEQCLRRTPDERLATNAAFVELVLSTRPEGLRLED